MSLLEEWGLTPEDDMFHPGDLDDPWWTETVWYAFFVPERKVVGYVYLVFRPNKNVQAGGVIVYDDTAALPWDLPVMDYDWHNAIPESLDLRDATLESGLHHLVVEPGQHYEVTYASREVELDLTFRAVMKPHVILATPPFNKGHIDAIMHVTGTLVLRGETLTVDSLAMRDRSWGQRKDGKQPTVGYEYATADPDNGFLAVSVSRATDVYEITTGYLMREGVWSHVSEGRRHLERDADGRPVAVRIEATDQLGRTLEAEGRAMNVQVFCPYPSMFDMNSLVDWNWDGRQGWGEIQDCWLPRRWREYMRARRP
jgi:hypothetical protein